MFQDKSRLLLWSAALYVLVRLVKSLQANQLKQRLAQKAKEKNISVGIIGAGVGGIATAKKCMDLGIPFHIYELANDFGGTWLHNTYPGCACDVTSHVYCFSWALNPNWSKRWADRDEIFAYFQDVARRILNLEPHTSFYSKVLEASFEDNKWHMTIEDVRTGQRTQKEHTFLVSSVGQLNIPTYPKEISATMDRFQGQQFHSARWPKDVDFTNKRVACVGTGASAIQFAPKIAQQARELLVFQRTPGWIIEKSNVPYAEFTKILFSWFPFLMVLHRYYFLTLGEVFIWWAFIKDSGKEPTWRNKLLTKTILGSMKTLGPQDETIKKLIPEETAGCKRLLQADEWMQMFRRDNVKLVCDPVAEITQTGLKCVSGHEHRDVDVIVYGTGFETGTFLKGINIKARDERTGQWLELHRDVWKGIPQAYRGVTFDKLPNFVCTYAPNTNVNHTSIISITECEVEHFGQLVIKTIDEGFKTFLVKTEAFEKYNEREQQKLALTAFNANCNSWYKRNEFQRILNNWHGSLVGFWLSTGRVRFNDYIFA